MMNPTTQLFERGEPPTMQEGDVLLTPIPQADGQVKTVPPFFSEKCLLIKVAHVGKQVKCDLVAWGGAPVLTP